MKAWRKCMNSSFLCLQIWIIATIAYRQAFIYEMKRQTIYDKTVMPLFQPYFVLCAGNDYRSNYCRTKWQKWRELWRHTVECKSYGAIYCSMRVITLFCRSWPYMGLSTLPAKPYDEGSDTDSIESIYKKLSAPQVRLFPLSLYREFVEIAHF